MLSTKTKTTIVLGVLLAAGTAILLKGIGSPRIDDSFWERDSISENLKKAPPTLIIRNSHFTDQSGSGWFSSLFENKAAGCNVGFFEMLEYAYGLPHIQMVLPPELEERSRFGFDFLDTLTNHPREEFQSRLKKQFGLTITREMRESDVLLLTVANPHAPGLEGSNAAKAYPLTNYIRMISGFFAQPVLDQTGLTGRYEFSSRLPKGLRGLEAGREAYRQALLDQLGLTLVPTNMPVEMLVVKQAQ